MNKYGVDKARKKCRNSIKIEMTIHLIAVVVIIVIGCFCVFGVYHNESPESAIYFALVFIVAISVYLFFSIRSLKGKIIVNKAKLRYLDDIDSYTSEQINQEIESGKMMYDTFYLLEDYFYAPKSYFIIGYQEIAEFKNIIHSTNGIKDSVIVAITDKNDVVFEISVKKWKDYYKRCNSISEILYEKQRNFVERKKI